MRLTLNLTKKQVEGLAYWHGKSADFGDVEYETGCSLVDLINQLAKKAVFESRRMNKRQKDMRRRLKKKPLSKDYKPYEPKGSPY